jgi:hypothetical protein
MRSFHESSFTICAGDATTLTQFRGNSFDIVHSTSVIEHVGNWACIERFAREANRLAPFQFVQTPNYWVPVEPHYVRLFHHWMPWPLRLHFHLRRNKQQLSRSLAALDAEPFLLNVRTMRVLFPFSRIMRERFLVLFTKSLIAVRGPPP